MLNNIVETIASHPVTPVASGGAGLGAISMLDAQVPTTDTASLILKVLVSIVSLIPAIQQIFKKRKTKQK